MNTFSVTRAFALALLGATIFSATANAAGLFDSAPVAEARSARPSPSTAGALRHRVVRLNTDELARILPRDADQAADRLERARGLAAPATIELFPGTSITAERTRLETPETGGFVWVGEGPGDAVVTLVVNEGEVLGHIQMGGKLYSIEPLGGGLHRVIEINQKLIRDDIHISPPASFFRQKGEAAPEPEATRAKTTIKVMVAHTTAAQAEIGTANAMQMRIDNAIALANTAFIKSGVQITFLRVGGANPITGTYNEAALYGGLNSSANYSAVLCDLTGANFCTSSRKATFNNLRNKRTVVGADLVVLMRKQGAACGIAWIGGFGNGAPNVSIGNVTPGNENIAFSVVTSTIGGVYNCIEGNTLAHEAGHNMGLNHDRKTHVQIDGYPTPPSTRYNFGYIDQQAKFFTIMSYRQSCTGACTRIQFFSTSNPAKLYNGRKIGIAAGQPGAADAARILNANRATVGGWRP